MEAKGETTLSQQVNHEGQKDTHSEITSNTSTKDHSEESRVSVSPVEGDSVEGGVGGGGSSSATVKKGKTSWKQPEKKNLSKDEKQAKRDSWPSLEEAVTPPLETTTPSSPSPSSTSPTTPTSSLASSSSSSPNNSSNSLPSTSSSLLSTPPTSTPSSFQSLPSTNSNSSSSKRGKKGMNWVPFKDIGPPPSSHFKHSNNQNHNPNNLNNTNNGHNNTGRRRNNRDFNSERTDRSEKSDRPERGERGERGERTDRADRDRERADRGDRGDRGDRSHGERNYRNNNFRHGRTRGRGYSNHYNNRQNAQYGSGSSRVPLFTPQYFPKEDLKEMITKQIEYYFSVENLCHDIFLRTHMDEEGWVAVTLIAQFPRILQLSSDVPLLQEAIKSSQLLELKDDKFRLTKDWQTWLIPKASALLSTPLIPSPTQNTEKPVEAPHEVESTQVENAPSTAPPVETAV